MSTTEGGQLEYLDHLIHPTEPQVIPATYIRTHFNCAQWTIY